MQLTHQERLRKYEQEKRKLQQQNLSSVEYMRAIKAIADKWHV